MNDIINPAYALERLKILAETIIEVATKLRERHPQTYETHERLGMLESVAGDFLCDEKRTEG